MDKKYKHIPYEFERLSREESIRRSTEFYHSMNKRRSCRFFSGEEVPYEVVKNIVRTGGTAPSGAHKQPWTFVVVGHEDKELRQRIRQAAEEEEQLSYGGRMKEEWREALAPIGTDWRKPFLETAPYLIVVFRQKYGLADDGSKEKHYYTSESVGIAVGLVIAAIHNAGLATLTHTPSPMKFLTNILGRPENEVPLVLLPVGYPAADATVPDLRRKPLEEILVLK